MLPTSGRDDCHQLETHAHACEQRHHRAGRSVGLHRAGVFALFDIAGPEPGDERSLPVAFSVVDSPLLSVLGNLADRHSTVIHQPCPDVSCTGADHGRSMASSEDDKWRGVFRRAAHGCRTSSPELCAHAQVRELPAHRRIAASSSSCPWCFRRIRSGGQGPWNRCPKPVERPSLLGSAIRATTGIRE